MSAMGRKRTLPTFGKTKRLGTEVSGAGYTNVRRYQLGAPGWRTLASEAMQTDLAALRYIARDKTAVWIDAREPEYAPMELWRGDMMVKRWDVPVREPLRAVAGSAAPANLD